MAPRLPIPGKDNGTWGDIMNDFLSQSLNADGSIKPSALNDAGTYAKPQNGIPTSDLDASTQTTLSRASSAYVKPANGIPAADLSSGVQSNLSLASSSVQLAGDLGGSKTTPIIAKLQGVSLNGSNPTNGQVLTYSSSAGAWVPGTSSNTTVNDATTASKGIVQLTGDLGGTASSPTVPGLVAKLDTSVATSTYAPKASPTFTGSVTVPVPSNATDAATKSYVDSQITSGAVADATTTSKGKIKLAGDLSGTADTPIVSKLSGVSITGTPTNGTALVASSSSNASWTALPSAPVSSVAGKTGVVTLTKADVNLANVDNTSDLNKPISTATQAGLNLKADTTSLATVATSGDYNDLTNKPTVATPSDATTSAKGVVQLAGDLAGTASVPTVPGLATKEPTVTAGTTAQYYRGDKTWQALTKTSVGLAAVDNTSDASKPISAAAQAALNLKAPLESPTFTGSVTVPTPTATTDATTKAYVDAQITSGSVADASTTTKGKIQLAGDLAGTAAAPTVPGLATKEPSVTAGTTLQYYRGDKSWQTLDKSVVGLSNVDNTSDTSKNSATATLTNKTISGSANTLSNIAQSSIAGLAASLGAKADVASLAAVATSGDYNDLINKPGVTSTPDATLTAKGILQLAGDLAGTAAAPTVPGLATKEPIIAAGTALQYYRGDKTWKTLDKAAVGLANVNNTSDVDKPVSTATQTALNAKVDTTSLATVATSGSYADLSNKPTIPTVSDATFTAKGILQLAGDLGGTAAAPTVPGLASKEPTVTAGTTSQYYRGDKSWQTLDKSAVGLSNVDNTSDANKPISSSTQTALNAKAPLVSPTFTGTITVPAPTNNTDASTKLYVDTTVSSVTTADATTTTKGKVQLAGDLGGTATSPVVAKVNGITVSGMPTSGQVLTASSTTAASWATPMAGSSLSIGAVISAAGALVVGKLSPIDATSGSLAMTLPSGQAAGSLIAVRKHDTSINSVTITGNINGTASTTHTLVLIGETVEYETDGAGSWWVIGGNKTLASLDSRYVVTSSLAAKGDLITATAANTPTKLAAGTDGYVLTANSASSSGLAWQAAPQQTAPSIAVSLGLSSSTLANWRMALGGRYLTPARVVCIGSSTTQGYNSTFIARRYVNRLGTILHNAYSLPGVTGGFHTQANDYSGWTKTGTNTVIVSGLGLSTVNLSSGATMSQTFTATTGFTVYFVQGPGSGAFTVSIDGGAATTVTPDTSGAAGREDGSWKSSTLSLGSHSILITASAATGISGVYVHNGDEATGVQVFVSGKTQTTSADWNSNFTSVMQRLNTLQPGLVTIMLGSNDFRSAMNPATFKSNIQSMVNSLLAMTPAPSVLLIHSYQRIDWATPTYPWSAYRDQLYSIANSSNGLVGFVDLSGPYPLSQTDDTWDIIASDNIHQTDRGHGMMADMLAQTLGAIPAYNSTPTIVTTTSIDPTTIPNLSTQFKASSISGADGSQVTSWSPSAGTETNALTATAGSTAPILKATGLNSLKTVSFTAASSQGMDTGAWTTARPVPNSIFVVAKTTSSNAGNLFSGRSGVYCYAGYGGSGIAIGAGASNEISIAATTNAWHVFGFIYNGASSSIWLDTKSAASVTGTTGTGASASMPGLRLGTNSAGSASYLDGEIAEMLIYNRALTTTEIANVMQYLGNTYNLTLS